jgi:phage FluMu protein Com
LQEFRCKKCQKLLAKYRECRILQIKCTRCGETNHLFLAELQNEIAPKNYTLLNKARN